jgi:hypothetical protein
MDKKKTPFFSDWEGSVWVVRSQSRESSVRLGVARNGLRLELKLEADLTEVFT